jgi:transposase
MSNTRNQYTKEFKLEAVKLLHKSDKSVEQLAKSLGVAKSTLHRWQSELQADPAQAFPGNGQLKERDVEMARLNKELRQAQMENEILKKAVAIFTQSQR